LAEPLRLDLAGVEPDRLVRALVAAAALDTSTLVCLAGDWFGGEVLVGWNPAGSVDRLADLTEDGCWIGRLDYSGRCWFGRFDTLLRRDPAGTWWLTGDADLAPALALLGEPAAEVRLTGLTSTGRDVHLAAVEHAISAIRAGQLYQVNVCTRLTGRIAGPPLELFLRGVQSLSPAYAAYLHRPDGRAVVSLSPELFLHRQGDEVRSAPIKGTRPRTGRSAADDPGARELLRSAKDRAENVMIVDLVRNDLARVCQPGTVHPGQLLGLRPAAGVWHLVSEVIGRLTPGTGTAELVEAAFPPGSVTGAPKLSACALIDRLEPAPRGLFTGSIGVIEPARAELSVAIRTFEFDGDRFELGVGGGITADSVPMAEWQECQAKAVPLLALGGAAWPAQPHLEPAPAQVDLEQGLLETVLCRDGRLVGLTDHLARLEASCLEVYGWTLPADLAARLTRRTERLTGRHRLRLTAGPAGALTVAVTPAPPPRDRLAVYRAARPVGNWRHKWADRSWLAGLDRPDASPLFADSAGCVAELGHANLALLTADGAVRTPALTAEVLPGVTRRRFLDAALDRGWRVEPVGIGFAELHTARLVLALSSLGEIVLVDRLDGVGLQVDHRLLAEVRCWLD